MTQSIVADNGNNGILVRGGSIVTETSSYKNLIAISLLDGSVASECATVNNSSDGIAAVRGVVRGCMARSNGDEGINTNEALVDGNSSNQNTNAQITSTGATVIDNHTEPRGSSRRVHRRPGTWDSCRPGSRQGTAQGDPEAALPRPPAAYPGQASSRRVVSPLT